MKVDPRFLTSQGAEIFTGSELLLKGALEADGGVHLLGGYPGSPIAGFFDSMTLIKDLLIEKGIHAVINNNEALAVAMLNGSQAMPCRAIICMKSVGVHVAADALAIGNMGGTNPRGGAIVIYGDDPWSDSTQVAADSRYISKHLYIPTIEPSNAQEVKDYIDLSFKLSNRSELYVGYILTTNLADGGGSVECKPNQYPAKNTSNLFNFETAAVDFDKRVLLPPRTWWQEETYAERFVRACEAARDLGLNHIDYPAEGRRPLGFISSGLAHAYLVQTLSELGVLGEFPILKLGLTYPVDPQIVRELGEQAEQFIVVEERRGFLEEQVSQIVLENRQQQPGEQVSVWGKRLPGGLPGLPATRGLHPSIIAERLVPLLKAVRSRGQHAPIGRPEILDQEIRTIDSTGSVAMPALPFRSATYCPGCPHRDSSSLCLEIKKRFMDADYMTRKHNCGPVDLIFHGDIGCYTMLMFPPNTDLMHNLSGMGLGGGTGSGVDPFVANKQVVFMGDSTFFHSGLIAISQAIKLGQDITFIILDNSTTGMTGHQTTPALDFDVLGNPTATQDIEEVVRGITAETLSPVIRVDPEKRQQYGEMLEQTFLADGVKVILAIKECAITRNRRKTRAQRETTRHLGFLPVQQHMNINQEVCRFCLACMELAGCPGLKHVRTDYGPKMDTDTTWCVDDGACHRVGACWSFERVTVKRRRPPRSRVGELNLDKIPEPQKRPVGDLWRCCLAGVGGMGIGLATSILVRAGHKEGYPVVFLDKKGLAIRNGGVVSQIVYNIADRPVTGVIPFGKADLLLGVDILEATRTLDPNGRNRIASKDRTAAVINTHKVATIRELMGLDNFDVDELARVIRTRTRSDDYMARDISRICEEYLGSKLYANIMMLGFAFQKGLIPVSMHSMAWAIKDAIRANFRKNLYAFNMGRKLVVQPDLFQGPPQRTDWASELEKRCRNTIRRYRSGHQMANELRELAQDTMDALDDLEEPLKRAVVVRLYDCMRWGGIDYARQYAEGLTDIHTKDSADHGFAATRAVIHNLASAMLIKDAVFIAELATSPEKHMHDRRKYNITPANGDRITYHHLLHSNVKIGRRKFALSFTASHWMLRILKRMRFLRKLLPAWHKTQRQFLATYVRALAAFDGSTGENYQAGLVALASKCCMECINPRCAEAGCPLAGQIPQWLNLACQQDWLHAADILHEKNNFPEFTSRICPAPCQVSCKQALAEYPVQIRDIESRIIEKAFEHGWVRPRPAQTKTGRKVAVVGSGPAGLAAAQQLARAGHDVTVFESSDAIGGMLRYGVPDWRLEKWFIDRRLQQLRTEGVTFKTSVKVGTDIPGSKLKEDFDAICLALGAPKPRDLKIPGRDAPGIHFAMDFLTQQNRRAAGQAVRDADAIYARGKTVVVIGGGETGNDCVETALAQGAKKVHQLEILSELETQRDPMHDRAGGVERQWCVVTKQFAHNGNGNGSLELRGNQVQWIHSTSGPTMIDVPDTEFTMTADLALLALGFEPIADQQLTDQLHLELDSRRYVVTDDCATSVGGIFAAGDLVTGASLVANAISSGRKTAEKIDEFLTKL